jgi:hypothetical protein
MSVHCPTDDQHARERSFRASIGIVANVMGAATADAPGYRGSLRNPVT